MKGKSNIWDRTSDFSRKWAHGVFGRDVEIGVRLVIEIGVRLVIEIKTKRRTKMEKKNPEREFVEEKVSGLWREELSFSKIIMK